jgi:hypothetical protein
MADTADLETLRILVVVFGISVILIMVLRIFLKHRKGSEPREKKEPRVLKAVDAESEIDVIYNALSSTKRIAADLRRRGVDTKAADDLLKKAEAEYRMEKKAAAKMDIEEAKGILMRSKKQWDDKTGFDVVPTSHDIEARPTLKKTVDLISEKAADAEHLEPEKEFPELAKAAEKKPDNFLPSKFTISLAGTAIENARVEGAQVDEAQRFLIEAKACFEREDYDDAFRLALCSKREAEALLGVAAPEGGDKEKVMSDLATLAAETQELMACSVCGVTKAPYICIDINGVTEATCEECYNRSMGKIAEPKVQPPPPPPPPEIIQKEKEQAFCPNCGAKVKAEDVFCGKCGKPVKEELKCVGCGTKVEPGDVFCRKCGARLVT